MPKKQKRASTPESGMKTQAGSRQVPGPRVQLFGHVTFVKGMALPAYLGSYALVALRDTPGKTVAAMTSEHNLQTLFETALTTGNLISFTGSKPANPPTPEGGTWAVDVYLIDVINLYNMH